MKPRQQGGRGEAPGVRPGHGGGHQGAPRRGGGGGREGEAGGGPRQLKGSIGVRVRSKLYQNSGNFARTYRDPKIEIQGF